MASLFGSWGSDPFAELVEKATSELLPAGQEDIALNLEICDQVRAKTVPAKQAMQTLKRRLGHKNPNVVLLALGLTDICIKNGGDHFLAEVASREFMDNLASILRNPSGVNFEVKSKALRLIQDWAQISEAKPQQMGTIIETYKSLKASGFDFPARDPKAAVSAALVETLTAPEWTDGEVCMRCRTAFTTFNRKHHCRNCGNVFCQDCSSKSMSLPWYGIGQDVRVCDGCFVKKAPSTSSGPRKLSRSQSSVAPSGRGGSGSHHRSNTLDGKSSGNRQNLRKKEDDDLALAIKLSLEASGSAPSQPSYSASSAPVKEGRPTKQADGRMLEGTDADDDPDLAAAIAASLRDYAPPAPSAPNEDGRMTPRQDGSYAQESRLPLPPSLELPATDVDAILTFAQTSLGQEMYARQHGRWQAGAGIQQQLQDEYERATGARPRMAKSLDEATRRHNVLLSMHDKLSEAVRLYDRLLDAQMNKQGYADQMYRQHAVDNYTPQRESMGGANMGLTYEPRGHPPSARQSEPMMSPNMYPGLPNRAMAYPNGGYPETSFNAAQSPVVQYGSEQYPQEYFAPHQGATPQYENGAYHGQAPNASAPAMYTPDSMYGGGQNQQAAGGPSQYVQSPYDGYERADGPSKSFGADEQWISSTKSYQSSEQAAPVQAPYGYYPSAPLNNAPVSSLNEAMASIAVTSPSNPTQAIPADPAAGAQDPYDHPASGRRSVSTLSGANPQGWRNVPIEHTGGATLSSAPPPPQGQLSSPTRGTHPPYQAVSTQLPSMPSAPLGSPRAGQTQQLSYDSMGNVAQTATHGPAMMSPAQQWSRPVETPLIDL